MAGIGKEILSIILAIQKVVDSLHNLDPILCLCHIAVQRNHDLLIAVPNLTKRGKFPLPHLWGVHRFRDLDIFLLIRPCRDKVNLLVVNLADSHIIMAAQQLEVDDVFKNVAGILLSDVLFPPNPPLFNQIKKRSSIN